MRRFEPEATSAAALKHLHIATIHEIGEHGGAFAGVCGAGEKNQAFTWLEKRYQDHEGYVTILKIDHVLGSLY